MNNYAQVKPDGTVAAVMRLAVAVDEITNSYYDEVNNITFIEAPADINDRTLLESYRYIGGEWVDLGPKPSQFHNWDNAWILDQAACKYAQWEKIKGDREKAKVAPVMQTRFGIFDANPKAMDNVVKTVIGLTAAQSLGMEIEPIEWTMADANEVEEVELTFDELKEVAVLLLGRGNAAHQKGRALKAMLYDEAVTTLEQIQAITWETDV